MIDANQIPDEVVEAGVTAWLENASDYTRLSESIRASIAAALNAWPGSELEHDIRKEPRTIHLPIPEASDE